MARVRGPLRAALLILLALLIAFGAAAPAFAADARDPRCEDWEAALTPPPGIDMSVLCPPAAVRTEAVDLDNEPLLPYVVGLVVMAVVLATFGVVAMRVTSPKKARARPAADWWTCPACDVRNRPDRATCFACQASRADAPAQPAETTDPELAVEGSHPV